MFAHLVRYEVGQAENAEAFIDEVLARFDAMQDDVPGMVGSFLLTRRDDGEALQITLWATEEDVQAVDALFEGPAPEQGAREVVTGRRSDVAAAPLWDVWQGKQAFKTD